MVQDKGSVIIIHNEKYWFGIPYQQADVMADVLKNLVKKCEEWVERERITKDQAILMKTNHPFALSYNKEIIKGALNKARNDSQLNKQMGSHVSPILIGVPSISVTNKDQGDNNATKR